MKKYILLINLLLLFVDLHSQDDPNGLSSDDFKRIYNREFVNIVNGGDDNSLGNFTSFDLKDAKLKFGYSLVANNGHVLNFTFNGAAPDGVSTLFSKGEISKDLGFGLKWNVLGNNMVSMTFNDLAQKEYYAKMRSIDLECKDKALKIKHDVRRIELNAKKDEVDSLLNNDNLENKKREQLELDLERIIDSLDQLETPLIASVINREQCNKKRKEHKKKGIEIEKLKASWITFGINYSNLSFKHLDPTLALESMITASVGHTFDVNVTYSLYSDSFTSSPQFFQSGLALGQTTNYKSLKKTTVIDVVELDPTRTTEKETIVYQGDFKTRLVSIRLFADYYNYRFAKGKIGFHLFGEYNSIETIKNQSHLGSGVIFAIPNKAKDGNIVNIETFLKVDTKILSDIEVDKLSAGLQITKPINIK